MTAEIADLQVRLVFQEDLLESLSARVAEQQSEINELKFQLNYLNQKFQEESHKDSQMPNIADEKPPHY